MPSRPSRHPLAVEFGHRVHVRRIELRLSRAQLAESVGLSEQRIGAIERGDYVPNLLAVVRLHAALDCAWDALLAGLEKYGQSL